MRPDKGGSLIYFPLDGQDLALLVEAHGGNARCTLSRASRFRRQAKMRGLGLWREDYGGLPHPIVTAAAAAFEERPDLPETMQGPDLPVLASLPDRRPWFPARRISGLERHTWGRAAVRLHRAALVLKPPNGAYRLNEQLPAVDNLVTQYRQLHANAPTPNGLAWRPVFQYGIETFWQIFPPPQLVAPHLQPAGLNAGIPLFDALMAARAVLYRGPRQLDDLDHLIIAMMAAGPGWDGPDARIAGVVTAAIAEKQLDDRRIWTRASYYGIEEWWRIIVHQARHKDGPLWQSGMRIRAEFGVHEGFRVGGRPAT